MPPVKGHTIAVPMEHRRSRYRIWRTLRSLGRTQGNFTLADVIAASAADESNVRKYTRHLLRAGYLAIVQPAVPAHHHRGWARYRLVRDTGPEAPRAHQNGSIFDPNLKEC
jgi:hypothetical protein